MTDEIIYTERRQCIVRGCKHPATSPASKYFCREHGDRYVEQVKAATRFYQAQLEGASK